MTFTMWFCNLKVGKNEDFFSKIPSFTDFMHVSYMIHWALVDFLFLLFTPIPLAYLQIEKNDKIPHVNVHRVNYEQFPNLIDKIHFYKFPYANIDMPNLPSVSYMIGQFQDAGRKSEKGGKSFRKLKYWSLVQP